MWRILGVAHTARIARSQWQALGAVSRDCARAATSATPTVLARCRRGLPLALLSGAWLNGLACGGSIVSDSAATSEPSPGSSVGSDAGTVADAASATSACQAFQRIENTESRCEVVCEAVKPDRVDYIAETVCSYRKVTMKDCVETCREALTEVDPPCGETILERVSWSPPRKYSNDWEYGCSQPASLNIDTARSTDVSEACAASAAHQRCLREHSPTPLPIGQGPSSVIELGDAGVRELVSVDDRFVGIGPTREGSLLVAWNLEAQTLWSDPDAAEYAYWRKDNIVQVGRDRVAILQREEWPDTPARLSVYGVDGGAPDKVDAGYARYLGSSKKSGLVTLAGSSSISVWSEDGTCLDSYEVPGITVDDRVRLLESAQGDLLIATENTLSRVTRASPGGKIVWTAEHREATWTALTETSDGRIVVGGQGCPFSESFATASDGPLASGYSADGTLLWEWWPRPVRRCYCASSAVRLTSVGG